MLIIAASGEGLGGTVYNLEWFFMTLGNWGTCIGLGLVMAFVIIGIPNIIAISIRNSKIKKLNSKKA